MKDPSRGGFALYLVLAATALLTVVALGMLRQSQEGTRRRILDQEDLQASVLGRDAERAAAGWLLEHGPTMTTPTSAPWTGKVVVDARFPVRGVSWTVQVMAWDACGGVPVCDVPREQWRAWLPEEPMMAGTGAETDPAGWLSRVVPERVPCFPEGSLVTEPVPWALRCSPWSTGRINGLTADPVLLQRVATMGGNADAVAQILEARRRDGRLRAPLPSMSERLPVVVAGTDRWQLLVVVSMGDRTCRWWVVAEATEQRQIRVLARYAIP